MYANMHIRTKLSTKIDYRAQREPNYSKTKTVLKHDTPLQQLTQKMAVPILRSQKFGWKQIDG